MRTSRGVTLIELLVVVALVGIIVGLAAPAFNDMIARQRVRSYTDTLVGDIAFARSEAVGRRQAVRMAFGTAGETDCYALFVGTPGQCDCAGCGAGATELKTVNLPHAEGMRLTSAVTSGTLREVAFDPVQAVPDEPNYDIDLSHARGARMRARITPLGQVRTCSPNASIPGAVTPCP